MKQKTERPLRRIKVKWSAAANQWFFVVVGRNGKTIATGETYHNIKDLVKTASLFECQITYPKKFIKLLNNKINENEF